jgi:hypothetical protein
MSQFKALDSYPTPLSPSRADLARLIEARDAASAELETLTARVARLARAKEAIAPLESELTAMSIRESAVALAWAEADDGSDAPAADTVRRSDIESKLTAARAQATAADGATRSVASQVERVNASIHAISERIRQAAASIVVEEAETIFSELTAAAAAFEAVKARVSAARSFMLVATEPPAGQAVGAVRLDFEGFDRRLTIAAAKPAFSADPGEWFSLAVRLAGDAAATL